MKKRNIIWIGCLLIILLSIFRLDEMQQKHLMVGKNAYRCMENGDYEEALKLFELYLAESPEPQSFYWKMFDFVNQGSNLSYNRVQSVIDGIKEKQMNIE